MSLLAEQAAVGSDPTSSVERLRAAADSEPDAPVAPAFRLWAADGLGRAGRDREAVAAYDETLPAAGRSDFEGIDFATEAFRNRAGSLARLGDVDGAVAGYRDLAARGDAKQALFRAGVVAERGGRRQQAIELYEEAADPARRPGEGYGQAALRAAQRLAGEAGAFAPSPLAIADRLKAALSAGDADQLRRLASPTHLQAGPGGGHFQFEDEEILEWLCEDLSRSRPRPFGRRLLGTGGKRYLLTSGWRGKHFKGIVGFCLTRSARGWEWSGILVTGPSDPWLERWEPAEKATNQPLPFGLLAPWPEGKCFTAGGLPGFIAEMAVIAGAWSFFGFIGAGIAFAFSGRDCGFGLRGFYYNEGPTHSGSSAFAIDFTTYRRWAPFVNAAGGVPVLSAANGIVRMADGNTSSGDSSHANEVQINHDDPATGNPRFVSRYMHMAGPGMIPVSAGMVAPTGGRLGVINDTGNSVLDHLHFSIHDTAAGGGIGPSVRPTPMEGRSLGDRDSGTCICSTNEERVVIDLPPGCVEAVRREGCARILKRLLGSGR
jgi:tetratricopeptide (TPR) repeat protein